MYEKQGKKKWKSGRQNPEEEIEQAKVKGDKRSIRKSKLKKRIYRKLTKGRSRRG